MFSGGFGHLHSTAGYLDDVYSQHTQHALLKTVDLSSEWR